MAYTTQLVFSIIEFLKDQMATDGVQEDSIESLEVAIECLERAYGIDTQDTKCKAKYKVDTPLTEIFESAARRAADKFPPAEVGDTACVSDAPEASDEDRSDAADWKSKGNDFMKQEKFIEAFDCYTKAIHLDSKNAVYYCNRAASLIKMKKHTEAIEDCHRAVTFDPSYSRAYGRMGMAHTELGEHADARECYRKASELDPENEAYKANLQASDAVLRECSHPLGSLPGLGGNLDFSSILGNPNLMNMAYQMMNTPQFQNMMTNMMSGGTGNSGAPPDLSTIVSMGQQMATQMRESNPELVEQLRQFNPSATNQNEPDDKSPSEPSDK